MLIVTTPIEPVTYKEVKQCIQSFVYGVNTPSRWGTQAPFTNITLDWTVPNDLAELPAQPVLSPLPKKPPDFLRNSLKSKRKRQHMLLTSLGSISLLM